MKRILCLLIIFSLLMLGVPTVYGAAQHAVFKDYADEAGLIKVLNIADIHADNSGESVTRQEYAVILYKMLGLGAFQEENGSVSLYSDVSSDSFYAPYINALSHMKIITGFQDGSFCPEQEITLIEAATALVNLLGYRHLAMAKGGFPSGYLEIAHQLALLKGQSLPLNERITKADILPICYNALQADLMLQDSVSNKTTQYKSEKGRTILSEYFRLQQLKGVVEGIDLTKLTGENDVPPWHILIGTKLLDIGSTNPNGLLGFYVEAYYEDTTDTLIYIFAARGKNNVTDLPIEDIERIEDNTISTVEEGGKERKYKYSKTAAVIYNEMATTSVFDMEMLTAEGGEKKNGTVRLLDHNNDGTADVIFVSCWEDVVVGQIDALEKKVYDYYTGKEYLLDLASENPYVLLLDEEEKNTRFSNIKMFDVLSVYSSCHDALQQYTKAYISKKTVQGTVESISSGDIFRVRVDGTDYSVTESCRRRTADKITVGGSVTLLLNRNGMAAGIRFAGSEGEKYACLIDAGEFGGELERIIKLKLLTEDNMIGIYDLNQKVVIDNVRYQSDDENILKILKKTSKLDMGETSSAVYTQMIRYRLDENGAVKMIDTVAHDSETPADGNKAESQNSLYSTGVMSQMYLSIPMSFSGKTLLSDRTKIFVRPPVTSEKEAFSDEENYTVWTAAMLKNTNTYSYNAYFSSDVQAAADMIAVNAEIVDTPANSIGFVIVDRIVQAVNADGEIAKKMYVYSNGAEAEIYAREDAVYKRTVASPDTIPHIPETVKIDDLKRGDAVFCSLDRKGCVVSFELVYRALDDTMVTSYNPDSFTANKRIYSGYVYAKYQDGVKFKVTDDVSKMEDSSIAFDYIGTGGYSIMVYDRTASGRSQLKAGSLNSMKVYQYEGTDCSKIIIQSYQGRPVCVYIIR